MITRAIMNKNVRTTRSAQLVAGESKMHSEGTQKRKSTCNIIENRTLLKIEPTLPRPRVTGQHKLRFLHHRPSCLSLVFTRLYDICLLC
jgi:hypothetical protein